MKEYKLKIRGNDYSVAVFSVEGKEALVSVNGVRYRVDIAQEGTVIPELTVPQRVSVFRPEKPAGAKVASTSSGKSVSAPLPGVILNIYVKEGQTVQRGQKVAVIEAMKMENDILAPIDGVVSGILVSEGESVLEGARILTIK